MFEILLLMGCSNNVEEVTKGLSAPGLYVTLSAEIQGALKSQKLLSNGQIRVQLCIDSDIAPCESTTPEINGSEAVYQWDQTSGGNRAQHTYQVEILYTPTSTNETALLLAVANKASSGERVFIKAQELFTNPYDANGKLITADLDSDSDTRSNLAELMEGGNPNNPGPTFLSPATVTLAEGKNNLSDFLFYTVQALSPRMQSANARQPVTYSIIKDATDSRIVDLLEIDPNSGKLSLLDKTTNILPAYHSAPNANNTYKITLDANDTTTNTQLVLTLTLTDSFIVNVKVVAKALYFEWESVTSSTNVLASYYKLYENSDGKSGFSVIPTGNHIVGNNYLRNIALYLNDMSNAQYYLEAYGKSATDATIDILLSKSVILQIKPEFVKALDYVGYVKASDTQGGQYFGRSVSLSGDGYTLAVGAETDLIYTGAVYLYTRESSQGSGYGPWTFATKLTAPNAETYDYFGASVALSVDGEVLAVGATHEDNAATGTAELGKADLCPGTGITCVGDSGAVYLFQRPRDIASDKSRWAAWTGWDTSKALAAHNVAYLKAPNAGAEDHFGASVALSADGAVLVVGADLENNGASGIAKPGTAPCTGTTCVVDSGAVYVFHSPLDSSDKIHWADWTKWQIGQTLAERNVAYLKAPNSGENDRFGKSVALSADGSVIAVGAYYEDNAASGTIIVPGGTDDCTETVTTGCASDSGAVYVFQNLPDSSGNINWANWAKWDTNQTLAERNVAYLKAPNAGAKDHFGASVALSADGAVLAVGAFSEDNAATSTGEPGKDDGCTGIETTGCASDSGAVYVFQRPLDTSGKVRWTDWTGWNNNNTLADNNVAYLKAPNAGAGNMFGWSVTLSADGAVLAVGAVSEDNAATSTGEPGMTDLCPGTKITCVIASGAVYVFQRPQANTGNNNWAAWSGWEIGSSLTEQNVTYLKASNAGKYDYFGLSVALSADGAVLAVGADGEGADIKSQANSPIQGVPIQPVNGMPTPVINDNAVGAGAVYLY